MILEFRRPVTLAQLCAAVAAFALVFGVFHAFRVPGPWYAAIPLSIALLIPIFFKGGGIVDYVVVIGIGYVSSCLMLPAVATQCFRNRKPPAPATKVVVRPVVNPISPPGPS